MMQKGIMIYAKKPQIIISKKEFFKMVRNK